MARRYLVYTPSGNRFWLMDEKDKSRAEIIQEQVLNYWSDYCNSNWLNYEEGNRSCPENKVKWLLESCANFMLMGGEHKHGVLSPYKEQSINYHEIPVDLSDDEAVSVPDLTERQQRFLDNAQSAKEKQERQEKSKPSRLSRMSQLFSNGRLDSARVDTQNEFSYGGKRYRVSESVAEYRPQQTDYGLLYDADRVLCYFPNGGSDVRFYSYGLEPLDGLVSEIA